MVDGSEKLGGSKISGSYINKIHVEFPEISTVIKLSQWWGPCPPKSTLGECLWFRLRIWKTNPFTILSSLWDLWAEESQTLSVMIHFISNLVACLRGRSYQQFGKVIVCYLIQWRWKLNPLSGNTLPAFRINSGYQFIIFLGRYPCVCAGILTDKTWWMNCTVNYYRAIPANPSKFFRRCNGRYDVRCYIAWHRKLEKTFTKAKL